MTTYADVEHNVAFIQDRESSAAAWAVEAVVALRDVLAAGKLLGFPPLVETHTVVLGSLAGWARTSVSLADVENYLNGLP